MGLENQNFGGFWGGAGFVGGGKTGRGGGGEWGGTFQTSFKWPARHGGARWAGQPTTGGVKLKNFSGFRPFFVCFNGCSSENLPTLAVRKNFFYGHIAAGWGLGSQKGGTLHFLPKMILVRCFSFPNFR